MGEITNIIKFWWSESINFQRFSKLYLWLLHLTGLGTLSGSPDVTYVTAKDTMTQVLAVTAFSASATIKAGEIITITGRNQA